MKNSLRPSLRGLLAAAACALFAVSAAADALSPEDALKTLSGTWTIEGREQSYREVCELRPGGRHLLCRIEQTRSGKLSYYTSIMSWVPSENQYRYHGFGSDGEITTQYGAFDGKLWTWRAEYVAEGKTIQVRVTMRPNERGFMFREEESIAGAPTVVSAEFQYLRLE